MVDVVTISDNNVTLEQTAAPVELVVINSVSGDTSGVTSVNGDSGPSVTLDADDISDTTTTNKFATAAELAQIATNQTNIGNNTSAIALKQDDLDLVSQADAEAGTSTVEKVWTAQRVSQAIAALVTHPVVFLDSEFKLQDNTSGFQTSFNLDGLTANRVMTMPDFAFDYSDYFDGSGDIVLSNDLYSGAIYLDGLKRNGVLSESNNSLSLVGSGTTLMSLKNGVIRVVPTAIMGWTAETWFATLDTGWRRNAAGIVEAHDGTNTHRAKFTSVQTATRTETADYTIDATTDHTIISNSASALTHTLPTAVGIAGQQFLIKNRNTGLVTIATTSSQLLDDSATWTLNKNDWIKVESDGTNWIIIG